MKPERFQKVYLCFKLVEVYSDSVGLPFQVNVPCARQVPNSSDG